MTEGSVSEGAPFLASGEPPVLESETRWPSESGAYIQ
jgi:hypothetical protein